MDDTTTEGPSIPQPEAPTAFPPAPPPDHPYPEPPTAEKPRANLLGRSALDVAHGNVMRGTRKAALDTEAALRPLSAAAAEAQAHLAYWAGVAMMLHGMGMDDPFDPMPLEGVEKRVEATGTAQSAALDVGGAIDPAAKDPTA